MKDEAKVGHHSVHRPQSENSTSALSGTRATAVCPLLLSTIDMLRQSTAVH